MYPVLTYLTAGIILIYFQKPGFWIGLGVLCILNWLYHLWRRRAGKGPSS